MVSKVVKTDSLSALVILTNDGGSWRTRHLRLRSMYARQSVAAGEWSIQHVAGECMIADIGTKALTSVRLEFLEKLMGMGVLKEREADRPPKEKEADRPPKEKEAERPPKEAERPPEEKRMVIEATNIICDSSDCTCCDHFGHRKKSDRFFWRSSWSLWL